MVRSLVIDSLRAGAAIGGNGFLWCLAEKSDVYGRQWIMALTWGYVECKRLHAG